MLDLEKALNVHQTLQAGSAMKEIYSGMSKTLRANADNDFIDNAVRIQDTFGVEAAERYLAKQGLIDLDDVNTPVLATP